MKPLGKGQVQTVIMRHHQWIQVETDNNGKFITLREQMPPLTNYERLQMPTVEDEKNQRKLEWDEIYAKAYQI